MNAKPYSATSLVSASITIVMACGAVCALVLMFRPRAEMAVGRDTTVDYLTDKWITKATPMGLPNESWAHDDVRKNMAKDIKAWRKVAHDPRNVVVSKTSDTETYVITIWTADG